MSKRSTSSTRKGGGGGGGSSSASQAASLPTYSGVASGSSPVHAKSPPSSSSGAPPLTSPPRSPPPSSSSTNVKHRYSIAELRALSRSREANKKPKGIPPEIDRANHHHHHNKNTGGAAGGSSNKGTGPAGGKHHSKNIHNPRNARTNEWNAANAPVASSSSRSTASAGGAANASGQSDNWRSGNRRSQPNSNSFSPPQGQFEAVNTNADEPEPEWADVSVNDFEEAFDFTGRVLDRDKDKMGPSSFEDSRFRKLEPFGMTSTQPPAASQPSPLSSSAGAKKLSRFGFALEDDDANGHEPVENVPVVKGPPPGILPPPGMAPMGAAMAVDPSYSVPETSRFAFAGAAKASSVQVPSPKVFQPVSSAPPERSRFGFALESSSANSASNEPISSGPSRSEQSRFAFAASSGPSPAAAPAGGVKVSLDGLFKMAGAAASELPPMPQISTSTAPVVADSATTSRAPSYIHSYMRTYGDSSYAGKGGDDRRKGSRG